MQREERKQNLNKKDKDYFKNLVKFIHPCTATSGDSGPPFESTASHLGVLQLLSCSLLVDFMYFKLNSLRGNTVLLMTNPLVAAKLRSL